MRFASQVAAVLAVLLPAVCVFNAVMNHYFVDGGYLFDSGWFAFLVAAAGWPLPNPPFLDGSYFATHLTLLFYAMGAVAAVLPAGPHATFALFQGLWSAVAAGAVLLLADTAGLSQTPAGRLAAVVLSVGTGLSGPVLATAAFPHPEIAMPALILLALALWLRGRPAWGLVVLAGALVVREDAGLHAGLVFGAVACWRLLERSRRPGWWRPMAVAAGGIAAAAVMMAIQRAGFPGDDALTRMYLGEPPFAHVDGAFLRDRARAWFRWRWDVLGPLLVLLGWALAARRLAPALGVAAVLPYLAVSFLAVEDGPGWLIDYDVFPLLIALAWPLVAANLEPVRQRCRLWRAAGVQALALALSIGLLPLAGPAVKADQPWRAFDFAYTETYRPTQRFMAAHRAHPAAPGFLLMGDGPASLMPELVGHATWLYPGKGAAEIRRHDTAFVFDTPTACAAWRAFLNARKAMRLRRVVGTRVLVATTRSPEALPYALRTLNDTERARICGGIGRRNRHDAPGG